MESREIIPSSPCPQLTPITDFQVARPIFLPKIQSGQFNSLPHTDGYRWAGEVLMKKSALYLPHAAQLDWWQLNKAFKSFPRCKLYLTDDRLVKINHPSKSHTLKNFNTLYKSCTLQKIANLHMDKSHVWESIFSVSKAIKSYYILLHLNFKPISNHKLASIWKKKKSMFFLFYDINKLFHLPKQQQHG